MSVRSDVLDQAQKVVTQDRNSTYGEPEDSFGRIAALWNAYLGHDQQLTTADVAAMMMLLKVARIRHNPTHLDSWVDAAGYAACGAQAAAKTSNDQ